jgi:acetylornithine deacetylase
VRASSPDGADEAAAIDLLGRLVAFDTVSARSNLALIEAVDAYLRSHGVRPVRIDDSGGDKAGLFASIGPATPGGVVLSGHTDVVPVEGQSWSSDPFTLAERDGHLFGRGTADMKGFIAAVLAAVPLFTARQLRVPIQLAFSHDEEVGCLGAPRLIEALLARVPRPAAVVVGEPTGMQVADRHRGITTFVTTISAPGGHSSAPRPGVNAIALAARFVTELEDLGRRLAGEREGPKDATPEHTTLNVGRIEGGTAVNMIAEHCRLSWECRPEPGRSAAEVVAALEARLEGALRPLRASAPAVAIVTEQVVSVPPFAASRDSPAVALALRLTGRARCVAASFASEAGLFQEAGVPAVVCGPGRTSEAHQPDEFVSREQMSACLSFMHRLADWASEPLANGTHLPHACPFPRA